MSLGETPRRVLARTPLSVPTVFRRPFNRWWPTMGAVWVSAVVSLAVWWAIRPMDEVLLELRASRDASAEIPVYAQFAMRQTFRVPDARAADVLVIPVVSHAPTGISPELTAVVEQGEVEIGRGVFPVAAGTQDLRVPVRRRTESESAYTVLLAAPTSRRRADAPRVFYEPSAEGYPEGRFASAGQAKPGNIALSVHARTAQGTMAWRRLRAEPRHAASWLQRVTLFLLVLFLPAVLSRRDAQAVQESENHDRHPPIDDEDEGDSRRNVLTE